MVQIQQAKADSKTLKNTIAEPPQRNRFYALNEREEEEKSTYVDNGNFLVFSFPIYELLDQGYTLSMVTPFVSNQFDLVPGIIHELFFVSTPIKDSVKDDGACREIYGIVEISFEIKLGVSGFKS